jgi:hypothetical protein
MGILWIRAGTISMELLVEEFPLVSIDLDELIKRSVLMECQDMWRSLEII